MPKRRAVNVVDESDLEVMLNDIDAGDTLGWAELQRLAGYVRLRTADLKSARAEIEGYKAVSRTHEQDRRICLDTHCETRHLMEARGELTEARADGALLAEDVLHAVADAQHASDLARERQARISELEDQCIALGDKVVQSAHAIVETRAAFQRILDWDCLNPTPRSDLLQDLPWLKRLVLAAFDALPHAPQPHQPASTESNAVPDVQRAEPF